MCKINSMDRKAYIYPTPFHLSNSTKNKVKRIGRHERRKEGKKRGREGKRKGGGREGRQKEGRARIPLGSVAINLHSSTQIMTGFVFSIWIQFIQIIAT